MWEGMKDGGPRRCVTIAGSVNTLNCDVPFQVVQQLFVIGAFQISHKLYILEVRHT